MSEPTSIPGAPIEPIPPPSSNSPDPLRPLAPAARPFPIFPYFLSTLLSLCVLGAGLAMLFWMPDKTDLGTVTEVRLTASQGIDIPKLEDVLDTPDYFVEIITELGAIRSETFDDTPLGNGLSFKLPAPVRLADIREVKVWDENAMRKDSQVDRIDRPARAVKGQKFQFALNGPTPSMPKERHIGRALTICGGAALLLSILHFLRMQAL